MKLQGLQFPLQDASLLIAPLDPDRSFVKYGESTRSRAPTQSPFLCYASCPNELFWVMMPILILDNNEGIGYYVMCYVMCYYDLEENNFKK